MNEIELVTLTLSEARHLLLRREVSPLDLTQAFLNRIARLDGTINSFITVTAETALRQALETEQALERGETEDGRPLGSLHGLPVALKDLFETQDILTTAGSKFFADFIPAEDGLVVQKLKQAGAILLGKTNMHEIALGLTSVNPHYGPVRNPWALERVAGGSSGGSAAALAARLCPGALGTDTGGSTRVPAALCGVVGLKPTFGRVSLRGVLPLSWHLDHAGTMARRVQDAALLLSAIAGYDAYDPYSVNIPVPDTMQSLGEGVKGWRIALAEDEYYAKTDEQVQAAINEAARIFGELGAQVERVAFPGAYQAALANGLMVVADAAALHQRRLEGQPENFGADIRQRLETGASLPLQDYIQARRTQTLMRRAFEQVFEHWDILLTPTTPISAPPIEGPDAVELARRLTRYTAPFNLTGLPAISVPCGFTAERLPIGLQLIARPWAEAQLLQAAQAFESTTSRHQAQPPE
jgi:aspartyl-tRNA(Asn)/glutamyl-tRNA(Gln) amidotransferase subunit A